MGIHLKGVNANFCTQFFCNAIIIRFMQGNLEQNCITLAATKIITVGLKKKLNIMFNCVDYNQIL